MTRSRAVLGGLALAAGLGVAAIATLEPASAQIAVTDSTPADGTVVDTPVRTVRVWFNDATNVTTVTLDIAGPGNRVRLQGIHSMGENDLMASVVGPMPDGDYALSWSTMENDAPAQRGTIAFTVQRAQ